jgi:hypothetical protein
LGESVGLAAEAVHGHCTDLPPVKKKPWVIEDLHDKKKPRVIGAFVLRELFIAIIFCWQPCLL